MGKFFIARPIFAIALAAAIVLLGIISIFDLPIEAVSRHYASCRRSFDDLSRCRCRNREQCGRHARFAEHHGCQRYALYAGYERQRRVDESAGDLRYRIRSEHGRYFYAEQCFDGPFATSRVGDPAGRHHAQDHDRLSDRLFAHQRRTLHRRFSLQLRLYQHPERTVEDRRRR